MRLKSLFVVALTMLLGIISWVYTPSAIALCYYINYKRILENLVHFSLLKRGVKNIIQLHITTKLHMF